MIFFFFLSFYLVCLHFLHVFASFPSLNFPHTLIRTRKANCEEAGHYLNCGHPSGGAAPNYSTDSKEGKQRRMAGRLIALFPSFNSAKISSYSKLRHFTREADLVVPMQNQGIKPAHCPSREIKEKYLCCKAIVKYHTKQNYYMEMKRASLVNSAFIPSFLYGNKQLH